MKRSCGGRESGRVNKTKKDGVAKAARAKGRVEDVELGAQGHPCLVEPHRPD